MDIIKSDLLKVLKRLSTEIDLNCVDVISIDDVDFYWDVDSKELYNPLTEPSLMLGQVSDDWNELQRLLDNKSVSLSYDLKRLSVILKLLEYNVGFDWFEQSGELS